MESLNIEENIKYLVLTALNKYRCREGAAAVLEISVSTLKNKIKQYNISKDIVTGEYFLLESVKLIRI